MSKKNVLVVGKSGQLGKSLQKQVESHCDEINFYFSGRNELDLTKRDSVYSFFQRKNNFDAVINAAAYTAVDKAEDEYLLADLVNHRALVWLSEMANKNNALLLHISTDYVFNGRNYLPYKENDRTEPLNIYGKTKLLGEKAVFANCNNGMIIRTSWVYSEFGNNFLKTMLSLGHKKEELSVVYDQIGTPTYAKDIASTLLTILRKKLFTPEAYQSTSNSIYHFSSNGVCSWYDFAHAIFELSNLACVVRPIQAKDWPTPAIRPHYSVLNKEKIANDFQLSIPHWRDSLKSCLLATQTMKGSK